MSGGAWKEPQRRTKEAQYGKKHKKASKARHFATIVLSSERDLKMNTLWEGL